MQISKLSDRFGVVVAGNDGDSLFDIPPTLVVDLCIEHGVVYFTGYDPDLETFEAFTNQHCDDWVGYQGGAYEKRVLNPEKGKDIFSVNQYTPDQKQITYGLDFHSDMSYMKGRPAFLWFYMVQPSQTGGISALCECSQVLAELSEPTRRLFESQKIKYIREYPDGNWQVRFQTSNLGEVQDFCDKNDLRLIVKDGGKLLITEYVVSAIRESKWSGRKGFSNSILPVVDQEAAGKTGSLVRLEDDSHIPPDVINEIKRVTRKVAVMVPMKKHEIMWIDNTRMLHGRTPFDDPNRNLAVRHGSELFGREAAISRVNAV
jgi:alpha-ketoglutarate-dependent taurine dioxygenase